MSVGDVWGLRVGRGERIRLTALSRNCFCSADRGLRRFGEGEDVGGVGESVLRDWGLGSVDGGAEEVVIGDL